MTDATQHGAQVRTHRSLVAIDDRTRRRNAAEARFRAYGVVAITVAIPVSVRGLRGAGLGQLTIAKALATALREQRREKSE